MSSQDFSPAPYPLYAESGAREFYAVPRMRSRERYWLYGLLFALTLLTTTIVGTAMQSDFDRNLPFDIENSFALYATFWRHPAALLAGLPFSLTLMAILLAHEFGHYLAAMYHRVDASLPYFMPSPLLGTFGAFIRVRSPIFSKRVLFDIGISGPIAGFVFLLPALSVGLAFSKVIPGIAHQGEPAIRLAAAAMADGPRDLSRVSRRRHLPASGGAGGLGRDVLHRAQPAAHRPIGWRAHLLLVLSQGAQDRLESAVRSPAAPGEILVRLDPVGRAAVDRRAAAIR